MGREYHFGLTGFRLEGCSDSVEVRHSLRNHCSCSLLITISKLLDDAFYQLMQKCFTNQATIKMCILAGTIFWGVEYVTPLIMLSDMAHHF